MKSHYLAEQVESDHYQRMSDTNRNNKKLFVGNIHESIQSNSDLRKIFDQYGRVVECEKINGKDFAFVVN